MNVRRVTVLVGGLAMAASLTGLAGGVASARGVSLRFGTHSAAFPAVKIKPGPDWTAEINGSGCEVENFHSNGTFSSDIDSFGTWSLNGKTIRMSWTGGNGSFFGAKPFSGTFKKTPTKEFTGRYGGIGAGHTGQLVKGVVSTFNGVPC